MSVKKLFAILPCFLFALAAHSQANLFFKAVSAEKATNAEGINADALFTAFDTYQLDETALNAVLEHAPWESTAEAAKHDCVVYIPMGHGEIEPFAVFRVAMLDPELAAAFPYLRTYGGVSLRDARRTVRFSVTLRGFKALILQPNLGAAMVKPMQPGKSNIYVAYDMKDNPEAGSHEFRTGMLPDGSAWFGGNVERYTPPANDRGEDFDPVKLKIFRFCTAAVGEFTQDHGGTKPLGLSAVTEYTNMVSAAFERDIDVRLQLTFGTQYCIFTDPATDPYNPANDVFAVMDQNPAVLDQYTNLNSLDIGHAYIRGGGGVAGGFACLESKARGCSAGKLKSTGDYGDDFLYVVGQEVGHQLGGGHTWNFCGVAGNDQRKGSTAFEPGSGSTIMSYAGCDPGLIQAHADLYYHSGSIEEIKAFAFNIATCGSFSQTTNNPPVVTLPYQDNFSIPISTPFELNGSATDPDGDALTYSWEGLDAGPETPLGAPQGNAAIFRSWPAVDVSNRYFPKLNTILSNTEDFAEQLPSYTRDLTFRLTARDNRPNGGGVGWADVAFKSVAVAGPFLVQSPNTAATIWRVGELTEVRWDVANTNAVPVNCQHVNIRLSTDGGHTFPITLASQTENDGSHYVLVPNELTSQARVRVEAADNVFFDLSNANLKIQAPVQPSLTLGLSTDGGIICLPGDFSTTVNTASVLGYNTPVSLELVGSIPPGASASFSATTINPGESSTFSLNLQSVAVEGTFNFSIRAISGTDTLLRPVSIQLRRNDFSGFALQSPADGSTQVQLVQTLHWSKGLDADTYDVQFSDSPSFNTILASVTSTSLDSMKLGFLLEKGKAYYWRVRPRNECGVHDWSEPSFFSTYAEDCLSFVANDLPKNISANGTPTIESQITVVQGGIISDIVLKNVSGYHEYFKDLEAHLISPQGTDILLWKDRCANFNGSFSMGFSDQSPNSFPCPPPANGAINRSSFPLSPIIGQNSTGVWKFQIKDKVSTSGGALTNFELQFCQSTTITPPVLIHNIIMPVPFGANRAVTPDFLLVEDPNNSHDQLVFTLVTLPEYASLEKQGFGALHPGDQFTQADIDNGFIRYFDYGVTHDLDGFRFVVTDNEGGFLGTPKFLVQPTVATQEPGSVKIDFSVFPNPADRFVWVEFGQALDTESRITLFHMNGQALLQETLAAGAQRLQLPLDALPTGVYVVQVETEYGTGVRKLVIR